MIVTWLIYFIYYCTIARVFSFLKRRKYKKEYSIHDKYVIRHINDINVISYIKDNKKIDAILKLNNPSSINCFVDGSTETTDSSIQAELSSLCTFFIDSSAKVVRGFKTEWIRSWPSSGRVTISFLTEEDGIKSIVIDNKSKNKNEVIYIP
jgi:hypothetical protein